MIAEARLKALELFAQGRKSYKLMRFEEAHGFFEKALLADPTDGPSKIYLERCKDYIADPPPED